MITYQLNGEPFDIDSFQVIGDIQYPVGWFHDKTNRDAMGITEEEVPDPVAVPVVPHSVTRRQARQALLLRGLLDKVDAAIATIPDATQQQLAQIEWEDSLEFERNRPLVAAIGQAIGLDSAGLDELFIYAATL